jgi:MoxR-like ATPase
VNFLESKGEPITMMSLVEYEETYLALGVCVEANVPVILWGPPGQGKTSVIKALAQKADRHLEIILASIREPQDFAGLPSIVDGKMTLVAPDWAQRLADTEYGILFTDEVNTAPPSVQAALLRVCLDKVAGDCELGLDTSVIAAANPPEQAADGWDLAPPLANRFCHLDWSLPLEVVRMGLSGQWPTFEFQKPDSLRLSDELLTEKNIVSGFLTSRPDLVTALPNSNADQGRAFPTPRSWESAALLSAFVSASNLSEGVRRLLLKGSVGVAAAAEFISYRNNMDLPDPEKVLSAPESFTLPNRADQIYVLGAGILNILSRNNSAQRWHAAGKVLEKIVESGHPDMAVSFARQWLKIRPGSETPNSTVLQALVPLLTEAKLI